MATRSRKAVARRKKVKTPVITLLRAVVVMLTLTASLLAGLSGSARSMKDVIEAGKIIADVLDVVDV